MADDMATRDQGDAINDAMVEAMKQRRLERQDRRKAPRAAPVERRKICNYCFQPGDHASPAACLSALER